MKWASLICGPLLALIVGLLCEWWGLEKGACWTAGVTVWCSFWWVSEAIPISATALLPFVLFPAAGVLTHEQVAGAYGHKLILLFLGGFMLSAAMEKSGAHRRLALGMVRLVGGSGGRWLVLGFMLASAGLSMWISNTATVLMLLPIVAAVLEKVRDERLGLALTLGVAYGGSIGGLGTPIGSPPNVVFMGVYEETTGVPLGFVDWMLFGLPVVVIFLPIAWLWLTRGVRGAAEVKIEGMGAWTAAELRTLVVFALTATAWVTRTAPFGGWSDWLDVPGVGDSTVSLFAAVALFVVPNGEGGRLLDWNKAQKIPWGLLVLFGGGLAIARAFGESGLTEVVGEHLSGLMSWPVVGMLAVVCLSVTFLTEVTSNTATATMLMPILAAACLGVERDPAWLMVPATLSASCAFMLPVATPPNAIVFSTGRVSIGQMVREGVVMNMVGAAIITTVCMWLMTGR